jgi:hypothetical protein
MAGSVSDKASQVFQVVGLSGLFRGYPGYCQVILVVVSGYLGYHIMLLAK